VAFTFRNVELFIQSAEDQQPLGTLSENCTANPPEPSLLAFEKVSTSTLGLGDQIRYQLQSKLPLQNSTSGWLSCDTKMAYPDN